jgi:hypothetical protein
MEGEEILFAAFTQQKAEPRGGVDYAHIAESVSRWNRKAEEGGRGKSRKVDAGKVARVEGFCLASRMEGFCLASRFRSLCTQFVVDCLDF